MQSNHQRRSLFGLTPLPVICAALVSIPPAISSLPAHAGQSAANAGALLRNAERLEAAGSWQAAASAYDLAAKAFQTDGKFSDQAHALEKSAMMYEKMAGVASSPAIPAAAAPTAPEEQPAATGVSRHTISLPPLRPRPGYIIGRAVFANGRPMPSFTVRADSVASQAGTVQGRNGQYALRIDDPRVYVVQHVLAFANLTYQGQAYVLEIHPIDNKSIDEFRGDVKKGVVRDFVFRLQGFVPGHETSPPPPNVTDSDSFNISSSFEGAPMWVNPGLGRDETGTLQITLTPTGPLIDGSTGSVIRRSIPNINSFASYSLYDLPLGVYSATARLVSPNGATKPLHVRMQVFGTPITSGETAQDSVSISFPADAGRASVSKPTLIVVP